MSPLPRTERRREIMKLIGLALVTTIVLVTLIQLFPAVLIAQASYHTPMDDRANVDDHMAFTRQLAEHGTKLEVLSQEYGTMIRVPEQIARLEERVDNLVRMVYALLGGVFALLIKELWATMRALGSRRRGVVDTPDPEVA
jgi:hypothetical protein